MGDCRANLRFALEGLAALPGYRPVVLSSLYRTAPVGKTDQATLQRRGSCKYEGPPLELLAGLQALEKARGRERRERWGPRTLDLDLLLFGQEVLDLPGLEAPHPRLAQRVFVLAPLMEIAPDYVLPRWGLTAGELLERLSPEEMACQEAKRIQWE